LREFLGKHVPGENEVLAEAEVAEAEALLESGDLETAQAKLMQALEANPDNDDARFDLVKLLISMGQLKTASTVLTPCLSLIPLKLRFEALKHWLDAWAFVTTDPMGQWPLEKFDQLIAANKRDFEARYAKARVLLASDDWTGAMDELLEIIMRDKKWNDEAARKTMVGLLELLTPVAPKGGADHSGKSAGGIELMGKSAVQEDPQAAMVSSYRRKLSMMLN